MNCNYVLVNHTENDVTCFVGNTKDKQKFKECADNNGMELYIHIPLNNGDCVNLDYLFLGMWLASKDTFEFMKVLESYKQLEKLT
jgi:hypothetical protein